MSWWSTWREQAEQRQRLAHWRADGALDDAAWRRARELSGKGPAPDLWRAFLEHTTLWLAVALLGAAIICFIAANWEHLGRFACLYGLQAVMVLAALAAWRLDLTRPAGQAALLLAGILLGGVLALVGQTYQTGADTWQLFALWTALLLPWTIAGASLPIGLLWSLVANVFLWLYIEEHSRSEAMPWVAIGIADLLLFGLWQERANRISGLRGRTGPRLLALAALGALSLAALIEIVAYGYSAGIGIGIGIGIVAWLLVTAIIVASAWKWQRDIVILAFAALSIIVVDTCWMARLLLKYSGDWSGTFLLLALLVIGQAVVAGTWLRQLARPQAESAHA